MHRGRGIQALEIEWYMTTAKLNAFIALLYARGVYEAKNLDITYIWNKKLVHRSP